MNSYSITGIVKTILDETVISEKFRKREFVIVTDGDYPQTVLLQCTNDRCAILQQVRQGDTVTAHFNLNGREWKSKEGETKYFNTLVCWKLEQAEGAKIENAVAAGDKDELPF